MVTQLGDGFKKGANMLVSHFYGFRLLPPWDRAVYPQWTDEFFDSIVSKRQFTGIDHIEPLCLEMFLDSCEVAEEYLYRCSCQEILPVKSRHPDISPLFERNAVLKDVGRLPEPIRSPCEVKFTTDFPLELENIILCGAFNGRCEYGNSSFNWSSFPHGFQIQFETRRGLTT